MKSSREGASLMSSYFNIILKPNDTIEEINKRPRDMLESLLIVLISGCIFLGGIFLVGDLLYSVFFEQYSTFILENITSGAYFGFQISRYDYVLVFITGVTFIVKAWLFFSIMFFIFMRIFGEKEDFKEVLYQTSWTIFPWAWVLFAYSMVCWLFKFIFPLAYHYIFYLGVVCIFVAAIPITLQIFYNTRESDKLPIFKVFMAYYLILFVIVILWSYNHYTAINLLGFY